MLGPQTLAFSWGMVHDGQAWQLPSSRTISFLAHSTSLQIYPHFPLDSFVLLGLVYGWQFWHLPSLRRIWLAPHLSAKHFNLRFSRLDREHGPQSWQYPLSSKYSASLHALYIQYLPIGSDLWYLGQAWHSPSLFKISFSRHWVGRHFLF